MEIIKTLIFILRLGTKLFQFVFSKMLCLSFSSCCDLLPIQYIIFLKRFEWGVGEYYTLK